MSFVSEYLTPFFDAYSRAINGQYLSHQLQFKGSEEVGGDYISKVDRWHSHEIKAKYDDTLKIVKEPSLSAFLQDNLFRIVLNPLDRLITAFQAYPSLKARFHQPGTFSHTFTEIMNEGVIFGAFKGTVFNIAQLSLVLYPSVYFANKNGSDSKYLSFLSAYTILDSIFYPLDTLKNILYADTLSKYSLKTVHSGIALLDLFRGLPLKIVYNIPVLSGIYCTTQVGKQREALLCWAAAAILYPINTYKVRAQLSASPLSSVAANTGFVMHSQYRGVVPFILLNSLIGYCLRPLLSQAKLSQIETGVKAQLKSLGLE